MIEAENVRATSDVDSGGGDCGSVASHEPEDVE